MPKRTDEVFHTCGNNLHHTLHPSEGYSMDNRPASGNPPTSLKYGSFAQALSQEALNEVSSPFSNLK